MSSDDAVTARDLATSFAEIPGAAAAAVREAEACEKAFRIRAEVLRRVHEEVGAWRTHLVEAVDPPIGEAAAQGRAAARPPEADEDATRWRGLTEAAVASLAGVEECADAVVAWVGAARVGYDAALAQATGVKERFESLRDKAKERATQVAMIPDEGDLQAAVARVDEIIAWLESLTNTTAADQLAIEGYAERLVGSISGADASRFHDLRSGVEAVDVALRSTSSVAEAFSRTAGATARG